MAEKCDQEIYICDEDISKTSIPLKLVSKYFTAEKLENDTTFMYENFPTKLEEFMNLKNDLQKKHESLFDHMQKIRSDIEKSNFILLHLDFLHQQAIKYDKEKLEELHQLRKQINILMERRDLLCKYLSKYIQSKEFLDILIKPPSRFPDIGSLIQFFLILQDMNEQHMKEVQNFNEQKCITIHKTQLQQMLKKYHHQIMICEKRYLENVTLLQKFNTDNDNMKLILHYSGISWKKSYEEWQQIKQWINKSYDKIFCYKQMLYQRKEDILSQLEEIYEFILNAKKFIEEK